MKTPGLYLELIPTYKNTVSLIFNFLHTLFETLKTFSYVGILALFSAKPNFHSYPLTCMTGHNLNVPGILSFKVSHFFLRFSLNSYCEVITIPLSLMPPALVHLFNNRQILLKIFQFAPSIFSRIN